MPDRTTKEHYHVQSNQHHERRIRQTLGRPDACHRRALDHTNHQGRAQSAHVGRTTLFRWLREDENFRHCLHDARRNALGQATARLQQMAISSVDSLQQIIADDKSSAASRVSGIRTNLDYAYRAIELEDIEERLTRIEEAIAGGQVGGDE